MNKVITINLDGMAYQLEEGGYEALHTYLETAAARLEGNPDRDEILSDIERALGEKFRALLGSQKTVVATKEVAAALSEMGPVEADAGETAGPGGGGTGGAGTTTGERPAPGGAAPRRLYRIREGAKFAGVCNGIAAYVNIDPTIVRLLFVVMTMFWGSGLLVYLVMAFVVPAAESQAEKAAASGSATTAQEFIRRAKEGYYEAMKGFPDRGARREWKRRFKRDMCANAEQWRYQWHGFWSEQAHVHPGMSFTLPVLSMLHGAAAILWICALISLLATKAVFGMALPASMPAWVGAILLCIAYGIVVCPLKIARRVCYWGLGQPRGTLGFVFLFDAVIWLAVAVALLWLGVHYFPELRDAVQSVPALAHQAADDIQTWWKAK